MTATFTDLLLQAAACGGLVTLGGLAILLLPWREEELADTTRAVRRSWRLLDRALRTEEEVPDFIELPTTWPAASRSAARSHAA